MSDYKSTLNLPETSFPMRANLVQKEPQMLKFWQNIDAFSCMCDASGQKGEYTLHDGPPYANGHIHLGHALNKILKDIIVKSRNMMGEVSRYVPGWDCHGLPIEHKVEQDLKAKKKELPANVVRKLCREYANKYINIQREEFKRLGIFGTWDNPYLSMNPEYEAATAHELADFVAKGAVQRSKKPIHWCASCHTALAEAEVEYANHTSPSVYVRFPLTDSALTQKLPQADPKKAYIVIWTTTPWTLPDNMGIALHPEFDYALIEINNEQYIVAEDLLGVSAAAFGWNNYTHLATFKGSLLEGLKARHPFYDRDSLVVLGDHVTLDAGTGAVHTAPGHGREDYEVGLKYGLEIYSPIDDAGKFYDIVPFFAGLNVFESNPKVIEKLKEVGHLLAEAKVSHSYPHCWRCKEPVFFRATTQWFIMMEANNLRERTLEAIRNKVDWIPAWGEERIFSMIENRPDWCISRQRTWGVPIMALLCEGCGEAWNDPKWMHEIADRFASHPTGCDYWFGAELEDIAPENLSCPHCGAKKWKKETDILDVWFDSGTSWAAVVEKRSECSYPADMYLEGSDQHRGWFHSSLLVSMSSKGIPPYKSVLTHGYMVDGEGKKMSKSVGNVVAPQEIVDKYGAEILRLLVSSVDYREDIRYSEEAMSRLVDAYRRIRNTCRYLLGNLNDFTPSDAVPYEEMDPLDRFAISLSMAAHNKVQEAFKTYEFHRFYHTMHNLCVTDLSSFYLDVLKDRIYSYTPNSPERRSAQTALKIILDLLVRDMAPVLSFTAEEIFQSMPEALKGDVKTVFAVQEPDLSKFTLNESEVDAWEKLLAIRAEVTKAIEPMRKEGSIGHALDTHVSIYAESNLKTQLEQLGTDLRALFIVSKLEVLPLEKAPAEAYTSEDVNGLAITVTKASGEKCARCWIYSEEIGQDLAYPDVCPRCAGELRKLQA